MLNVSSNATGGLLLSSPLFQEPLLLDFKKFVLLVNEMLLDFKIGVVLDGLTDLVQGSLGWFLGKAVILKYLLRLS